MSLEETVHCRRCCSSDESLPSAAPIPPGTTLNPFKTALHKFVHKKKDRPAVPSAAASAASGGGLNTAATSSFFLRSHHKLQVATPAQPLPGSVKQVHTGQLPPVWATPAPAAPTRKSNGAGLADLALLQGPGGQLLSVESGNAEVSLTSLLEGRATGQQHLTPEEERRRGRDDQLKQERSSSDAVSQGERRGSIPVETTTLASSSSSSLLSRNASGNLRDVQFERLLEQEVVDLDKLRKLSWGGVPTKHQPTVWRLLLGYMPSKKDRRAAMLERKRQEYVELLQQYYYIPDTDRGMREQTTLRQILVDIPRTNADVKLFQNERIHQCMERVLYIWAIRHPASGYVQGINDLMTPFLVVFISAFIDDPQMCDLSKVSDANLQIVEADSYWCLTKLLDDIQDHYTFAQPGLQRMVQRMEELVHRCDAELFEHIVDRENVQFVQFAFRWMNCLLMRELPLNGIVRIWDTYLCEDSGFESFHVYVCAAILMTFGETLKTLEFQDLVLFLQSLPTKDWMENEIEPLLSRAFILQSYFADAPSHLSSQAAQ
uniref:Rab-GAP TBC domain-containing protein n=1 Tax=Peronospora matthiolae TaxID=2874970 RepID=A0AAV1TES1_9STRA